MSGYVYLIGPRDWRHSSVKIGTTRSNPLARLSALQTGCPFELTVFAFFKGGVELENVLHQTFAPLRMRGEWFDLDHKLRDLVSSLYPEGFGAYAISEACLRDALAEVVLASTPSYPVEEDEAAAWSVSARTDVLSEWMRRTSAQGRNSIQ